MFCPECGEEVKDSAKFCKNCGARIDNINIQNQNNNNNNNNNNEGKIPCKNCGKMILPNSSKCEFCGMTYGLDSKEGKDKYQIIVILGYLFATIGQFILWGILFFIGMGIGIYLWTRDNDYAKKHGKYMLIIGLVIFIITFIIGFIEGFSSTI